MRRWHLTQTKSEGLEPATAALSLENHFLRVQVFFFSDYTYSHLCVEDDFSTLVRKRSDVIHFFWGNLQRVWISSQYIEAKAQNNEAIKRRGRKAEVEILKRSERNVGEINSPPESVTALSRFPTNQYQSVFNEIDELTD